MEPINCPLCGAEGAEQVWREDGFDLVRCGTCDLLFVSNPPTEEELTHLYSFDAGYHDQLAGESDRAVSAAETNAVHHLDLIARVQRPGRLLDVGCATGTFMWHARERGWVVRGAELNDDTAGIAREQGPKVTTGSVASLDTDEQFDVLTMWDVVEHVPDPLKCSRMHGNSLLRPAACGWRRRTWMACSRQHH